MQNFSTTEEWYFIRTFEASKSCSADSRSGRSFLFIFCPVRPIRRHLLLCFESIFAMLYISIFLISKYLQAPCHIIFVQSGDFCNVEIGNNAIEWVFHFITYRLVLRN